MKMKATESAEDRMKLNATESAADRMKLKATESAEDRMKLKATESAEDRMQKLKREAALVPVSASVNRRLPIADSLPNVEIMQSIGKTKCQSVILSGFNAATLTTMVKVWYVPSGENTCSFSLPESKLTAVNFVASRGMSRYLWVGTERGELLELDSANECRLEDRKQVHNAAVTHIVRQGFHMYTLDDNGGLKIWAPDSNGRVSLATRPRSLRIASKISAALVQASALWCASARVVEVYNLDEDASSLLLRKLEIGIGTSGISCMAKLDAMNEVYTGHEDGNVTVFCALTYTKKKIINSSFYRITSMRGVGESSLWVGYSTGKITIFDTKAAQEWIIVKDFLGHYNSGVAEISSDEASLSFTGRMPVASVSESGHIKMVFLCNTVGRITNAG
jgi:hypothetical protein